MIRLFVALKIPEEIKDKIFSQCIKALETSSEFKWESKEKIHLTLKFIGDVKKDFLSNIIDEIEFVTDYSTFNCKISNFGFFFRDGEAKILWCNLETDEIINSLVQELNERISKFGVKPEKRNFKGHLTLLRIKNKVDKKFIKRFNDYKFDPIQFKANQISLIQSVLKPSGSIYKVLKIYELK